MPTTLTPYQLAEAAKSYQAEWEASVEIRQEFGGNWDAYKAYRDAVDRGLVPDRLAEGRPLAQLEEHIRLSWDTNYELRHRFANFEMYRSRRVFEAVLGSNDQRSAGR